jgi:hypothetical protein
MNWFTKTLSDKNGIGQPRFVVVVFGVIWLCCSFSAFADSIITDTAVTKAFAELDALSETGAHAEAITDIDLSAISGKGAEATKLESNDKFAVLLWDERGNGNRRTAGHDIDGSQGFQAVYLTVNRR